MDDDALALIDAAIANMQRLREKMASKPGSPDPDPEDDFADANLIELPLAAHRFGIAKDKLRRWCRDYGLGVLHGARWRVSIPRLRRHLGRL